MMEPVLVFVSCSKTVSPLERVSAAGSVVFAASAAEVEAEVMVADVGCSALGWCGGVCSSSSFSSCVVMSVVVSFCSSSSCSCGGASLLLLLLFPSTSGPGP